MTDLDQLKVRQYLNNLVRELRSEHDLLPIGSVGADRLFHEWIAVNATSMIISKRNDK